jgi:tetratricopeptide (TPR) repeat protein
MSVLLALFLSSLGASPLPAIAPAPSEDPISLEQMLMRYRAQQEVLLLDFSEDFDELVRDLEKAYGTGQRSSLAGVRKRLVQLGDQATPLFVDKLDPGMSPTEAQIGRAREIASALVELSTRNITPPLLAIFEKGTEFGQANALQVLSASDDPEHVGPVFRSHFEKSEGKRRGLLISAIASLGGEANFNFIGGILTNEDTKLVKMALNALTDSQCELAAPMVFELINNPAAAASHVSEIVEYYRANSQVIDEETCKSLLSLTQSVLRVPRMAELILLLLSEHEDRWGSKFKKSLRELSDYNNERISNAARICLARAGDHRMRKKLLEPFQERIDRNDRIASVWQARAETKLLIGDNKGAIKDFIEAQRLAAGYQETSPDIVIGIARAYARLGKAKDAAKWIGQGGFGLTRLHQLAKDRDFIEVLEDEDLAKIFRLEDR